MQASSSDSSAGLTVGEQSSAPFKRMLLLLFLGSLVLVNPIVHGAGVGYYAYARAPLIQHNLRFDEGRLTANLHFSQTRPYSKGKPRPDCHTNHRFTNR